MVDGEQHPEDARCFYCASDTEFARALGRPDGGVILDGPIERCPNVDPADFKLPPRDP